MVNFIYYDRRISGKRYLLTSTDESNINKLAFLHPLNPLPKEIEVKYLETPVYLFDYLKICYPSNQKLTFEDVVKSIPEDVLDNIFGVEFLDVFYCSEFGNIFPKDAKKHQHVVFVALLTEHDTGKSLPDGKFPSTKPIGMNDADWNRFKKDFLK